MIGIKRELKLFKTIMDKRTKKRLMNYLEAYKKYVKYKWFNHLKILEIVWTGDNVEGFICEVIRPKT